MKQLEITAALPFERMMTIDIPDRLPFGRHDEVLFEIGPSVGLYSVGSREEVTGSDVLPAAVEPPSCGPGVLALRRLAARKPPVPTLP